MREYIDEEWVGILMGVGFIAIIIAIAMSAFGVSNPLSDIVYALMGADACSVGSMRPGMCGTQP